MSRKLSNSTLTGSSDVFMTCMTLIFFSVFFTLVKARWLLSNLTDPTGKIYTSSSVFSRGITSPLIERTTTSGFEFV